MNTEELEYGREEIFPLVPVRNIVLFPKTVMPIFVGREKSIEALEEAVNNNLDVVLFSQINSSVEYPKASEIYKTGVKARIIQMLKLPDNNIKIIVEVKNKVVVDEFVSGKNYLQVKVKDNFFIDDVEENQKNTIREKVLSKFEEVMDNSSEITISKDIIESIRKETDFEKVLYIVAQNLNSSVMDKQSILEEETLKAVVEKILYVLSLECEFVELDEKIKEKVKESMDKNQKDYFLNEKLKVIQKELGDDIEDEISMYKSKIEKKKFSKEAKEKALSELNKLKGMSQFSTETSVVKNYLDWLVEVPWNENSRLNKDINKAENILNEKHFGLEKVKDRVLEYISVGIKTKAVKGAILCLYGPPGVGKTSLVEQIAKACGREFVKVSLGGMRDESEIRGHRRTYIGSMPGKIIQALRKCKKSNPVILLDEIDKISSDFRGDPSSALLEVLDYSQNHKFNDNYLEVDYDLSKVMFVATANELTMQRPLFDRLEIISLSGYTENEKLAIAKKYIVKEICKNNGIKNGELNLGDEVILDIIRSYTKETGVRELKRQIDKIARKIAYLDLKKEKIHKFEDVEFYLGPRKYRYGVIAKHDEIGKVNGLAWTSVGGEMLDIEAVKYPGKGKFDCTGKLGDVMKESIKAAEVYVRANMDKYNIDSEVLKNNDIHIHVPEGATPKDGPSAGIGMVTSIVSVLCGREVKKDVAMTGEVNIRGNVLAIGGLKEKLLAALRAGIKTAIIPKDNEKDLVEIPKEVIDNIDIIPVENVSEVIKIALVE